MHNTDNLFLKCFDKALMNTDREDAKTNLFVLASAHASASSRQDRELFDAIGLPEEVFENMEAITGMSASRSKLEHHKAYRDLISMFDGPHSLAEIKSIEFLPSEEGVAIVEQMVAAF